MLGQGQTGTDRDRQGQTGTRRDRQGRTVTDRDNEKQISRGKTGTNQAGTKQGQSGIIKKQAGIKQGQASRNRTGIKQTTEGTNEQSKNSH